MMEFLALKNHFYYIPASFGKDMYPFQDTLLEVTPLLIPLLSGFSSIIYIAVHLV